MSDPTPEPQDPESDPGVQRLQQAASDEERLEIESQLIEQTDNRPHEGDPEEQPT